MLIDATFAIPERTRTPFWSATSATSTSATSHAADWSQSPRVSGIAATAKINEKLPQGAGKEQTRDADAPGKRPARSIRNLAIRSQKRRKRMIARRFTRC